MPEAIENSKFKWQININVNIQMMSSVHYGNIYPMCFQQLKINKNYQSLLGTFLWNSIPYFFISHITLKKLQIQTKQEILNWFVFYKFKFDKNKRNKKRFIEHLITMKDVIYSQLEITTK